MKEIERSSVDCDWLRSFAVIAECGNLTVAAARLHRTQSAISVQLRRLETELGLPLFHRTSRGMTLTEAGERLLPRARAIVTQLREVSGMFADPLHGVIRVGFPDDFDEAVLEHVLAGFARSHPDVRVVASSGCTSGYPAAVRDGQLDMAVCSGPDNSAGDLLGVEETVWAAADGLRLDESRPLPLALLDRSCWWRDLPVRALDGIGRSYDIAFRSHSFASLLAAIRAGFAIGVVPLASIGDSMRVLTAAHGLPRLSRSRRTILIGDQAPTELAAAMSEAIRQGVAGRSVIGSE